LIYKKLSERLSYLDSLDKSRADHLKAILKASIREIYTGAQSLLSSEQEVAGV